MNKKLGFALIDLLGLNALLRYWHRGHLKILLYHSITDDTEFTGNAISPSEFNDHIIYLKKHYNIISMDQNGNWINYRKDSCNILITFDDGFYNNLKNALPILLKNQVSAVFFLIADCIERGDPPSFVTDRLGREAQASMYKTLAVDDAKSMLAAGMTIGSHSLAHSNHTELLDDEALADGQHARRRLEAALGVVINTFAFPWGLHTESQLEKFQTVYRRVFLTTHGFNQYDDRALRRNEVANIQHLRVAASGMIDSLKRFAGFLR